MASINYNNKRIAKNTVALYFRMLLTMAVGLFTSRVILDSLGVEDYGIYNLVGGFVAMFEIVRAGLLSATQRFITYDLGKGNIQELNKTFSTCVIIFIFISALIVLLAELIGIWFIDNKLAIPSGRINAAHWVFQLSLLTLIISLISYPYNALIIAHERMKAFAYISILEALAKLGVAYSLYISSFDKLILYAALLCLVQFTIRLIYNTYCLRNFQESRVLWIIDKDRIKQIFGFTGWELFGSIASIGFTQGLNVLLGMFFNPVVNAARGVAVQVQNVIVGFVTNFQTAINPQITKSYAADKKDYMYYLIFASSRFSYFLLLLFAMPLILEAEEILRLWLKQVPDYTVIFFRIIIVISMVDVISNSIITSVEATGRIKYYQIIVGGLLLLILPVSYVVLKLGGAPYSVFLVHLSIALIAFMTRLLLGHKIVGFELSSFIKTVLIPILIVTVGSAIIPVLCHFNMTEGILRLLVVAVLSILCVSIAVYFWGLKENERQMVITTIKNRIHLKK